LDQMGARSFAPDLGVWTSVDPYRVANPMRGATRSFAADHAYAYASLTPLNAVDPEGNDGFFVGAAGVLFGVAPGYTPGGALPPAAPLPEGAQDPTFKHWQAGGQILGAAIATIQGLMSVGEGAEVSGTGVGAIVGVPVAVLGAVQAVNGVAAMEVGLT